MGLRSKLYDRTGPIAFASVGNTAVLSPASGSISDSLYLGQIEVGNSSGANASCGWGYKLANAMWKAGQWQNNAAASYIDDTTDAQSSTTDDFPIATATNNDGYVIQAKDKFNLVTLVISTANNDAGTAEYTFWNGSAWASLPLIKTPTLTSTGTVELVFHSPATWTPTLSTDSVVSTVGLTAGMYAIRCRFTTKPSVTPGKLTSMSLVRLLDFYELVPDGNSVIFNSQGEIRIPGRQSIVPYCSTADGANWVDIEYRNGG